MADLIIRPGAKNDRGVCIGHKLVATIEVVSKNAGARDDDLRARCGLQVTAAAATGSARDVENSNDVA